MTEKEKENRINSFALSFLERQQIVPNLYADQIIRGYKEGYHQAEKDNELTWEDIERIDDISIRLDGTEESKEMSNKEFYQEVLKRFNKERKEYGGSDLVIKLLDGVIDAKKLSIQYVLDKLKAQKGEQV